MPILETAKCMEKQVYGPDKLTSGMVCAGFLAGGLDSCQGDSGGPLMTEVDGRWTLVGIVSAGYSCAKRGQPGIYHKVPFTSDWISHAVRS